MAATIQPSTKNLCDEHTTVPQINSSVPKTPFSLAQELKPFGTWAGNPIWVPPKDASRELAKSMLNRFGLWASKEECWSALVEEHRSKFTQVREIEMHQASIRLPKGKLFVSVTEREQFDEISDPIPNCVRTRLEEFLEGPGSKKGVKVYYLKPLCVEVGNDLFFTSREDVMAAINKIQGEVFSEYRRLYALHRPRQWLQQGVDLGMKLPQKTYKYFAEREKRKVDAYQARLEFNRRKTAFRAAKVHRRLRTDGCTFDEMLALTNPLERGDVVNQYGVEHQLSKAERERLLRAAVVSLPWFVALSLGISQLTFASVAVTFAPPLVVCDPAFVAEMPGSQGMVLKIGHFDEIGGIVHVEI
jgi:hypothetical protein